MGQEGELEHLRMVIGMWLKRSIRRKAKHGFTLTGFFLSSTQNNTDFGSKRDTVDGCMNNTLMVWHSHGQSPKIYCTGVELIRFLYLWSHTADLHTMTLIGQSQVFSQQQGPSGSSSWWLQNAPVCVPAVPRESTDLLQLQQDHQMQLFPCCLRTKRLMMSSKRKRASS